MNFIVKETSFEEIIKTILPDIKWENEEIKLNLDAIALEKAGLKGNEKVSKGTEFKIDFNKDKDGFIFTRNKGDIKHHHLGIDLSYGKEIMYNFIHPKIYSPVSGEIVFLDNTEFSKKIVINSNGYLHILEHFHTMNNYKIGDYVFLGKYLGNMGGTGKTGLYHYQQHIHYEIRMLKKEFSGIVNFENKSNNFKNLKVSDFFYLDPYIFWNNGREVGIGGFELKTSKEEEKSILNTEEKEQNQLELVATHIINDNSNNFRCGEITYRDKKWQTIEKQPLEQGVSFESLYEKRTSKISCYYNETNFGKDQDKYSAEKESKLELMKYGTKGGSFSTTTKSDYIELSLDKNCYTRIMSAKSSKDFRVFNDIFIYKEIEEKKNPRSGKVEEYLLKESSEALNELIQALEEDDNL